MELPKANFLAQKTLAENKHHTLSRTYTRISWIRTIAFLLWVMVIYFSYGGPFLAISIVFGLAIFVVLVQWHVRIQQQRALLTRMIQHIQDELCALGGDHSVFDPGNEYQDTTHPCSSDLDIFGEKSLFQHLNRTGLPGSKDVLASWLQSPATHDTCRDRQDAVRELGSRVNQTFELQAILSETPTSTEPISFSHFTTFKQIHRYYAIAIILAILSLTTLLSWVFALLPVGYFLLSLLANGVVIGQLNRRLMQANLNFSRLVDDLKVLMNGFRWVASQSFHSHILIKARQEINQSLRALQSLGHILYLLDSRANMMYWLFNQVLLIDVHAIRALHHWYTANANTLQDACEQLYAVESLASMARYTYTHPEFTFPGLEEEASYRAEALGHPLIVEHERVTNDFNRNHAPVELITGSNMSGKSTFLRTLGLNLVMAWTGLPVCAKDMHCSRYRIFTSMRTQDDLSNHTSSFYAELHRIQQFLHLTKEPGDPVFFLLDEILKGTNSHDRHTGARGLIEHLLTQEVYGCISTHDLDLAKTFENHPKVNNYHFTSQIHDDKIQFNYLLRTGYSLNTNATILMKQMGILPGSGII